MPPPSRVSSTPRLRSIPRALLPARGIAILLLPLALFAVLALLVAPAAAFRRAGALAAFFLTALDLCLRPPPQAVRLSRRLERDYRVGRSGGYSLTVEKLTLLRRFVILSPRKV